MMVGLKVGLSIGGALVTWILGTYNYIPKEAIVAGEVVIQPDTAIIGTKMLVSVFPSIPFLLGVALLFFYKINKSVEVQIEVDLHSKRA